MRLCQCRMHEQVTWCDAQKKDMLATTSPITIPGAEKIMIFLRPMMSMYFNAKSVNTKFVPETIRPTAVG